MGVITFWHQKFMQGLSLAGLIKNSYTASFVLKKKKNRQFLLEPLHSDPSYR